MSKPVEIPDAVLVLDRMLERLHVLREKAVKHPEFFNVEFMIDRGLEYDTELDRVIRKNPEITWVRISEILDPVTNKSI